MFPAGSQPILNLHGTAPGIDLIVTGTTAETGDGTEAGKKNRSSRIFALPGVPAEMKPMFDDTVAPRILTMTAGGNCIRHLVMKFFGTGESDMEQRLGEMISRDRDPRVGITVSGATISLRITATGASEEICQDKLQRTKEEIMQLIPDLYFGDGEQLEQYHVIDGELRRRGESLAVIELGSAAILADWFASLGPSSAYRGGVSVGSPDSLTRVFGGNSETETLAMAKARLGADWLLMVDRYPTLEPLNDRPMGAVEFRLLVVMPNGQASSTTMSIGGHPDILQSRIAKSALGWMRKQLTT
jgi:nicotinamide-nucleotide amidase